MKNFTHTHVHTEFSLLDGANSISSYVKRVKELGMTSCAITDHNHIGGVIDFQAACIAEGIKPILGCEVYQTWDMEIITKSADERREYAIKLYQEAGNAIPLKIDKKKITKKQINELINDYKYDTKQYHLILLAMNQVGYNNLVKLQSEASNRGTYNGRFCCDFDLLEKYNEGLICTSACLGGMIPNAIMKDDTSKAIELIMRYQNIFGDRFYIEIQPLIDPDGNQEMVNVELVRLANELGIKLVASNDVHYTLKEDFDDHDSLLCVGTGKFKDDENRMHYAHEFWVRSYDEMLEAFSRHTNLEHEAVVQALENTNYISSLIEPDIRLGSPVPLFPKVQVPKGLTPEQFLTLKTYKGLYKYKQRHPEINVIQYEKRIIEELDVINPKGFAPYMLKILENIEYCIEQDIPVGPGRGSAAGSLVLFLNGGTKVVDPIKYDLLFFRFLTADRKDPPDIDNDFSYYGRPKLIAHLEDIHGHDAVSHIGTYTEFGVKNGCKDFARVLGLPFEDANTISKTIDKITDEEVGIKFKDLEGLEAEALELEEIAAPNAPTIRAKANMYKELKESYPEIFRLAMKFEGSKRNMGCHPSGVLITSCPITDIVPTRTDPKTGLRIALFTGPQLESLNLIKLDILGLKNLDILDKTLKAVDPELTVEDLYLEIENHLSDPEIFEQVKQKQTEGLFQIESPLFKGLADQMQAEDINDICAMLALGRPGPLAASMDKAYANRKKGLEEAIPILRGCEDITKDTYNCVIYQEHLMLISKQVAGFNDAQSDSIIRKATAKKKPALMEVAKRSFIYGKINSIDLESDSENLNRPYYDPEGKYGSEIPGGISNGYSEEELLDFWKKIQGFCSYLFNRSHSASYAVITLCTMLLKKEYTSKFYAALLSMQTKEEKIDMYVSLARKANISVLCPDANKSAIDFKEDSGSILYGLRIIKGIGEASLDDIVRHRPYISVADTIEKAVPTGKLDTKGNMKMKKVIGKKILFGLIKSGAFDFENENRYELLNQAMDIRKDKEDRFVSDSYDRTACIKLEQETLGTSVTHPLWFDTINDGETFEDIEFNVVMNSTKNDKKGNLMAFPKLNKDTQDIHSLAFANIYKTNTRAFDNRVTKSVILNGKRDGSKIIISKVCGVIPHAKATDQLYDLGIF